MSRPLPRSNDLPPINLDEHPPSTASSCFAVILAVAALFLLGMLLSGCQSNPAAEEWAEYSMEYRVELILDNPNSTEAQKRAELMLLAAANGMDEERVLDWVDKQLQRTDEQDE